MDGSVISDRSGWRFTVKQGGRTVHEDSGAHRVTTFSLAMGVEAVTHAILWLASHHAIILAYSMHLLQKGGLWNRQPRLAYSHALSSAAKTSLALLPWACRG